MSKPDTIHIDDTAYMRADTVTSAGPHGDYVIVRATKAASFAGYLAGSWRLVSSGPGVVTLTHARRLYYWAGAATLSQLAVDGTSKPNDCKFPVAVPRVEIHDACEIIYCTDAARRSIEAVPVWSA